VCVCVCVCTVPTVLAILHSPFYIKNLVLF
jgi:hypothetical protein